VSGELVVGAPFVATEEQRAVASAWWERDWRRRPVNRIVMVPGGVGVGKSQGAGRVWIESLVRSKPTVALAGRLYSRELDDSTIRMFLDGDGALGPLIPRELIKEHRRSDNLVELTTGTIIHFRHLDDPAKFLNVVYGSMFIDQIEELPATAEGELLFDTLLGRLRDPNGTRQMMCVANPTSKLHWTYRRLVNPATRDAAVCVVPMTLAGNEANLPPDYVERLRATEHTRPTWYRTYVLGEWGSFESAAYGSFSERTHVIEPFEIPTHWERLVGLDHGSNHPTCALAIAADTDGNLVVFDSYYSPGLVSQHQPAIRQRYEKGLPVSGRNGVVVNRWRQPGDDQPYIYADPSMWANHGHVNRWGVPASIATEYHDRGTFLIKANHDRAAGHLRILESLNIDESRIPPPWADMPPDVKGAPRLFIFSHCKELIEQIQAAPMAKDGANAGEAVDPDFESDHLHAHAALRYALMAWPSPSAAAPPPPPQTEQALRRAYLDEINERDAGPDEERYTFL
jgi:PBSX family phage terminase large subunit